MGGRHASDEPKGGLSWSRFIALLAHLDNALTRILAILTTIGGIVIAVSQFFPSQSDPNGSVPNQPTDSTSPSPLGPAQPSSPEDQTLNLTPLAPLETSRIEGIKINQDWRFQVNTTHSCLMISDLGGGVKNRIEKMGHRITCCQIFYNTVIRMYPSDQRLHIFETEKSFYCERTCADIRGGKLVRREVC